MMKDKIKYQKLPLNFSYACLRQRRKRKRKEEKLRCIPGELKK